MRKKRRKEQAEERKRLREEKIRQSEDKKKEREAKKKEDAAAKEKRMQDKLKQVQDKKKKREVMSMRMKQLQHHRDKRRARIDRQAEDRRKKCQIRHTGAERGIEFAACSACRGRYHVNCLRRGTQPFTEGKKWICFACSFVL